MALLTYSKDMFKPFTLTYVHPDFGLMVIMLDLNEIKKMKMDREAAKLMRRARIIGKNRGTKIG